MRDFEARLHMYDYGTRVLNVAHCLDSEPAALVRVYSAIPVGARVLGPRYYPSALKPRLEMPETEWTWLPVQRALVAMPLLPRPFWIPFRDELKPHYARTYLRDLPLTNHTDGAAANYVGRKCRGFFTPMLERERI
jgi:hypothetical protein